MYLHFRVFKPTDNINLRCIIQTTAGIPTKKIAIFLTMAPPNERPYPMNVVTLATARVQDLIGLICWQYAVEGRQPPLKYVYMLIAFHSLFINTSTVQSHPDNSNMARWLIIRS